MDGVNKIQWSKHNIIENSIEKCIKPYDEEITKGISDKIKFFLNNFYDSLDSLKDVSPIVTLCCS